jgi:uncharacterized membrane protein YccC
MTQRAGAQSAGVQSAGAPGHAPGRPPGQPGSPWWRVSWSVPAAMRAVRATIVIPLIFALTFKVIGDAQMTLFAVFGGFAQLVTVTFGGTRRDKAVAHLGLAAASTLAVVIGTLASGTAWLAALVTLPVAFAIYFAGSAGPNAAAAVTPCLFGFVLPIASMGGLSVLPSRVEGWLIASAASTAAVLLLTSRSPGDRLRAQAAKLAGALAEELSAAIRGTQTTAQRDAAVAAKFDLMNAFAATPYRPIGLAASDQGLANLIHLLEWCTSLVGDAADGHLELPAGAAADRRLLEESAAALNYVAAIMMGQQVDLDLEALWRARLASAEHLRQIAEEPAIAVRRADHAFHAQTIGVATAAAMSEAMVAARRATPAQVASLSRTWIAGLPDGVEAPQLDDVEAQPQTRSLPIRAAGIIAADASLRSVWFRNSARGAIALAAAVAVAKLADVQHAFWIVLGTLSVLRSSATATGSTALRGLGGTIAGFAVGAAVLVGIGTSPTVLWVVFPISVLIAAYTPGTAPFLVGQAAFTVTIVVLFNLLIPAGWKVGLLRVEDVAIGCAVSLVVGFLFWPRGVSSVVGDNLADAFRSGASYLADATRWALGEREHRPERAAAAIAAGTRLDDAVRGYLTEQGSKRLSKADLWALVMAAMRLRLTAHSMASLPIRVEPHADDGRLHAALEHQVADLATFYDGLAAVVAKPARAGIARAGTGRAGPAPAVAPLPTVAPLPASRISVAALAPCGHAAAYLSDALWVGHHLDHLEAHAANLSEPAERLASLRRRPWWR